MMNTRKSKKKNNQTYANTFKPAMVLGAPTVQEMLNQVFLVEQAEDFDQNGNQLLYSDLGYDGQSGNPDAKFIYSLETKNPGVQPNIRQVKVKGKADFSNSFLFEAANNNPGIVIVMLKEIANENQIYCNIRYLPYTSLSDTIVDTNSDILEISIPNSNVVKLNVTLKSSNTEEILYNTHKTDVNLEDITLNEVNRIKGDLEFQCAKYVAYFTSLMLIRNTPDPQSSDFVQSNKLFIDSPEYDITKRAATGVSFLSTVVAGFTGWRAIRSPNLGFRYATVLFTTIAGISSLIPNVIPENNRPNRNSPFQPPN